MPTCTDCSAPTIAPASPADHFAIRFAGADSHAEPRLGDQQEKPNRHRAADADDRQAVELIPRTAGDWHGALQQLRNVEVERKRAEQPARAFGKDQDQCEGRQHLVEMVALVEAANDKDLDDRAGGSRRREAGGEPEPERAGGGRDCGAREGADHVERSMGKVDQPHDAEDESKACGHEEQHHAELQPVEDLFDEKSGLQGQFRLFWSNWAATRADQVVAVRQGARVGGLRETGRRYDSSSPAGTVSPQAGRRHDHFIAQSAA
jgi:hypothetical protein